MRRRSTFERRTLATVGGLFLLLVAPAASLRAQLTPIARWDVIPLERIERGEPFKAGVIAFSKAGIEKVRFTISGPGYSGPSSVDVTSMSHNSRTDVHEYWVAVNPSHFASAGDVTLTAVVHGEDGGARNLGAMTLIVDPTGSLPRPEAWVAASGGDDSAGVVGDRSFPFATIGGAARAIQTWMENQGFGARADGAIIRLLQGEHASSDFEIRTVDDWVTITCDPSSGGTKHNTVINRARGNTNSLWLKVQGLTLQSRVNGDSFFNVSPRDPQHTQKKIWIDDCRILGSGRYQEISDPIGINYKNRYLTNSYIHDVRRGQGVGQAPKLVRNMKIEKVGDDAFQNCLMVVNVEAKDLDPGAPGGPEWHSDAWQCWGPGPENAILYNYRATDLHYQGLFCRAQTPAKDVAIVNCLIELRRPIRDYGPGNRGGGSAFAGKWEHLVFWHNTMLNHPMDFRPEETTRTFRFSNCSFVGNVFYEWRTPNGTSGEEVAWTRPRNEENNEFLHNHYIRSRTDNQSDAHVHSKSPDTGNTQSVGDPGLVLDPESSTLGQPVGSSPLINRVTRTTVPADALGNARDNRPDIGAIEFEGQPSGTVDRVPPAPPSGLIEVTGEN